MKRRSAITHRFVESVPDVLEEGVVYVSIPFATVVHRCCCGCGQEVVTPLARRDWTLSFNGESISLHPSIGNWSFACQSHYWLRSNLVVWAARMSRKQIDAMRGRERQLDLAEHGIAELPQKTPPSCSTAPARAQSRWRRLANWLMGGR